VNVRSPFLVNVAEVRRVAGTRKHVALRAPLGVELRVVDTVVPADAEVGLDLELESVDDGLVATGEVRAPWHSTCRRCLGPASGELVVAVREVFSPHPVDEEIYQLNGDQVDLSELARDTVALELPLAPLCRDDCRGIGSVHQDELERPADPRWAALEQLRTQLDE
jgi:uncharacterized protein